MTSINDYLKKLLYQYDCVVVPELGAFLTHYQSASFTEANGVYLPPRKRVAFNEALRFDDGILLNFLMLHESIARDAAQRQISQFVGELHQEVDLTGRFELEGIGTFTKNEESRLQFSPSLRHNFFGEAFGLTPIAAQAHGQQALTEPAAIEAIPVTTAIGPVLVQEEEVHLEPYRAPRPYWRVAAIALLIGSLGAISYSSVMQPGEPLQSSLDPATLLRAPMALYEKFTAPATTSTPKAVFVKKPVAKATVAPATIKPVEQPVLTPEKAPEPVAEVTEKATERPKESSLKPEATPKPAVETVKKEAVVKPEHAGPHFTIIAGVFQSKQNALRLRRQLKKAGYEDAFVIMPLAGQKEMYKVAAAGSFVRSEAVSKMAAIDSLAGTESWIMKN